MAIVTVERIGESDAGRGVWLAQRLEEGHVLLFPQTPFELPAADREFLLTQTQSRARFHKNIAYRPAVDRLTGVARGEPGIDAARLAAVLRAYSRNVVEFLTRLFPFYARTWRVDYASFRPVEEEGRALPPRSRNDLIHVDAFPTRPTRGDRILRFFTNAHPDRSREWASGGTFDRLAERYAVSSGILEAVRRKRVGPGNALLRLLGAGRARRSPYDEFMLRFHDFLKQSEIFQASPEKERLSFPPGSSWIVYTDMVSHAVLSGQFALEQTVIIGRQGLVSPEKAPIAVLERLAGVPLA